MLILHDFFYQNYILGIDTDIIFDDYFELKVEDFYDDE